MFIPISIYDTIENIKDTAVFLIQDLLFELLNRGYTFDVLLTKPVSSFDRELWEIEEYDSMWHIAIFRKPNFLLNLET